MPDAGLNVANKGAPPVAFDGQDSPPPTPEDPTRRLRVVRETPFEYGLWNLFKGLYKSVEADPAADPALVGALLARIDDAPLQLGPAAPLTLESMRVVASIAAVGNSIVAFGGQNGWTSDTFGVYQPNPTTPLTLVKAATLNIGSQRSGGAMTTCGPIVCLAREIARPTLRLFDLSEPSRPVSRGRLEFPGRFEMADSRWTYPYLYLAYLGNSGQSESSFQGVQVVDISDVSAPRVAGELRLTGPTPIQGRPVISGGVLAFATRSRGFDWQFHATAAGLHLIDATNSRQLRLAGFYPANGVECVALSGGFAFLGIGREGAPSVGVLVLAIDDLARPRPVAFLPLTASFLAMTVSPDGRYLYVSTSTRLHTIDIQDPAAPRRVHTLAKTGAYSGVSFLVDSGYVKADYQTVAMLDMSRPDAPRRVGAPPSAATIGYMKRRGRRFLRELSESDPPRYVAIATELLLALRGRDFAIDPALHWALTDVLFGGGDRFRQTRHGRGRYLTTAQCGARRLGLRHREERAPVAWDADPEPVARLLQTEGLPLATYVFAARVLRANRLPLPSLSDATWERLLAGDAPLLIALGVRAVARRLLAGETMSPNLAADTFYRSSVGIRRMLAQGQGARWASDRKWADVFALRLAARLRPTDVARLSKREVDGAALLARHFAWTLTERPQALQRLIALLVAADRSDLLDVILAGTRKAQPGDLVVWLTELRRVTDARLREPVLAALTARMKDIPLERALLRSWIFHVDPFVREAGWRLIAGSATGADLLREVWSELFQSAEPTAALATAMASPDALGLLPRAGIGAAELATHGAQRPFLVGLLSPDAFVSVAAGAPAAVVLSLIAAAPDDHWERLRPVWLRQLREEVGLVEMWLAAADALSADETGRLEARLLGDAEIAETLLGVEDERVLGIRDPSFGPILGAWVARSAHRMTPGSELLYKAATHPLPEVRTPALAHVGARGMAMPFALRLMESAVPASVATGQTFFDAEPVGGAREADYALALCDSPRDAVRQAGCAYVTTRWQSLPHERILRALFENPDPEMQAFVADRLTDSAGAPPDATPSFDAEVLRTTNRARLAKERIKARQTAESTLDAGTLLTLARGRTARDAEWAFGELARRAARGEAIEGITLEGVMGI